MTQDAADPVGGVLMSSRLKLVPVGMDMAAELAGGWCRRPGLAGYPHQGTKISAAAAHAIWQSGQQVAGCGLYVIVAAGGPFAGLVIGDIGFHGPPGDERVEVGYGLAPPARGRGYASEALAVLCRWALARVDITRVIAIVADDNHSSRAVLRRSGFTYDPIRCEWFLELGSDECSGQR